jgi:hypothetical protein
VWNLLCASFTYPSVPYGCRTYFLPNFSLLLKFPYKNAACDSVIAFTHPYLIYQWQLLTYSMGIFAASSCQFSTMVWHMITVFISVCFQLSCTLCWSIAQPHISTCSQYASYCYVQYTTPKLGEPGRVIEESGFETQQVQEVFLFSTMSRLAVGPVQPPIWWVQGTLTFGGGGLNGWSMEQYLHIPMHLYGMVLNWSFGWHKPIGWATGYLPAKCHSQRTQLVCSHSVQHFCQ